MLENYAFYFLLALSILHTNYSNIICSKSDLKLYNTTPSIEDIKWCHWAVNSTGGRVRPGLSWGKLKNINSRKRFVDSQCDLISFGHPHPSCASKWGDDFVYDWKNLGSSSSCITSSNEKALSCKRVNVIS